MFEPRKPFVNPCLAQCFFFKASRSIVAVSAAVVPKRKKNLMQTRCSFKSAIEKSTKTKTEAQEKNHTDPIDLSSRPPLGQLMRRAVTYTRQAGTDGSTTPLPSRKNSRYFWAPLVFITPGAETGQEREAFFLTPKS